MKQILFSEKMKTADLVLANYRLLYVFPCFGIHLALGESSVKQTCEQHGISPALFLLVCNLYTFENYFPEANQLMQIPLDDLMRYLQNSHRDYLQHRLPKVIDQVQNLTLGIREKHRELLREFCEKYRRQAVAHFDYEEQTVFPYIKELLESGKHSRYTIREYERNHSDLNAALSDLKSIILKHLPPECPFEKSRNVLIDLFLFESDLSKHTLLEDQILIALVEQIEKKYDDISN